MESQIHAFQVVQCPSDLLRSNLRVKDRTSSKGRGSDRHPLVFQKKYCVCSKTLFVRNGWETVPVRDQARGFSFFDVDREQLNKLHSDQNGHIGDSCGVEELQSFVDQGICHSVARDNSPDSTTGTVEVAGQLTLAERSRLEESAEQLKSARIGIAGVDQPWMEIAAGELSTDVQVTSDREYMSENSIFVEEENDEQELQVSYVNSEFPHEGLQISSVNLDFPRENDSCGREEVLEANVRIGDGSGFSDETLQLEGLDCQDMQSDIPNNSNVEKMQRMELLRKFEFRHVDLKGTFVIQSMREEHVKATEELLVNSFAELMGGLFTYRPLLVLTVRQYLKDRLSCLPDAVTLVGLYSPMENSALTSTAENAAEYNWSLAGTVELSFSNSAHPDIVPGPTPCCNSPYLCNMAVMQNFRRRGLGRQLLNAAEELAVRMGFQDLYLHCRMVDISPLTMYQRAGYQVVATDSVLCLLTFQRRRHLMYKKLCTILFEA